MAHVSLAAPSRMRLRLAHPDQEQILAVSAQLMALVSALRSLSSVALSSARVSSVYQPFSAVPRHGDISTLQNRGHFYFALTATEYTAYFNEERPHQGIDQRIPDYDEAPKSKPTSGHITLKSILDGLHHSYVGIMHLN